ncbi:MAG: hypothetical protein AB2L07_09345 [Thermoanaerobaculaceae bacterium]
MRSWDRTAGRDVDPSSRESQGAGTSSKDVPADRCGLLNDMLRTITLFENHAEDSTFARRPDGTNVDTVDARARKLRADGQGVETDVPLDDWIDIGVFADAKVNGKTEEKPLYLAKHHVTGHDVKVEVVVAQKPDRAGIDPYNKLVDRKSDDNLTSLKEADAAVQRLASTSP